jgi:hypothetical protein
MQLLLLSGVVGLLMDICSVEVRIDIETTIGK